MNAFVSLFAGGKPVIGMIHLKALPGSPGAVQLDAVLEGARGDAEKLTAAGADGLLVENFGDAPFAKDHVPPVTVASMAIVCGELRRDHNVPLGVNVLRNDAEAALSIAAATDADFIRVNVHVGAVVADQGVIEGKARETLLLRKALGASVLLFADVRVKHSRLLGSGPVPDLVHEAREVRGRGHADVLILSGTATGSAPDPRDFRRVKEALPDTPLLVGSGADPSNLGEFWPVSDGVIVGSALKVGGDARAAVDSHRARAFVEAASELRRQAEKLVPRGN